MRLPLEIICAIASQLGHRTLLSMALTSKSIYEILKTSLARERDVREEYRIIDVIRLFPGNYGPHRFLKNLLYDDRLSEYVVKWMCGDSLHVCYDNPEDFNLRDATYRLDGKAQFDSRIQHLLKGKLARMTWIPDRQRSRLLEGVLEVGCETAILSVLLCMLVELRDFLAPSEKFEYVEELVKNLGNRDSALPQPYHSSTGNSEQLQQGLVKLELLHSAADNGTFGLDPQDLFAWMGLPNLKRVIISCSRADETGNLTLPQTPVVRSPDIYLIDSCVSREVIAEIAKCIHAPCTIRQSYGNADHWGGLGYPTWDHCEITENANGIRKINIEFRYPNSDLHDRYDGHEAEDPPESPAWKIMGGPDWSVYDWTFKV